MAKSRQDIDTYEGTYDDTEDWLMADLQDEDDETDVDDDRE
jgi:hypothetical protein